MNILARCFLNFSFLKIYIRKHKKMKNQTKKNPILWVPTTYFAMGIPFIALSIVATIMFKDLGVSNKDITIYTSLLTIPWSLKWLFSPIMETFGTKKKYIVFTEIISAVLFGLIIFALPLTDFFKIILAIMAVIAVSGSVHDIAGDGVYMEELDSETQSVYSGWQGAFYNMAKILSNGGLVFLAGWLVSAKGLSQVQAWQIVMAIFAILMLGVGLYHIKNLPNSVADASKKQTSFKEKMIELAMIFVDFFQKKYIWLYLIFVVLYRFSEGLAIKIAPIFLKEDRMLGGIGLNNEEYGLIYGTLGAVAFVSGSILSGYYISRYTLKKVLFSLVCIFNIPFVVYLLLAWNQPTDIVFISIGIIFEYFTYGFGFVGITLFMMQQIAPGKYQMAHYAIANSLMNLGVMLPGIISGSLSNAQSQQKIFAMVGFDNLTQMLSPYFGYPLFFVFVMIMTLPAIILSLFIPFVHSEKK